MPYCEIIYETGRSSVAYYETDDEAKQAIKAHHERALKGESGGPTGAPAERIKRVLVYPKHPNDYNTDQTMTADVATEEVAALIKAVSDDNGIVHVGALSQHVQALSHPMVASKETAFDSNFKMKQDREMKVEGVTG